LPPPIGDQSEEPPPTSYARLGPSRRRLPRFEPRPLRRRSSHGQQPSRHVDERVERPCPLQHGQFARRLDSEPVLTALDNQPKMRADDVFLSRYVGCCVAALRGVGRPFILSRVRAHPFHLLSLHRATQARHRCPRMRLNRLAQAVPSLSKRDVVTLDVSVRPTPRRVVVDGPILYTQRQVDNKAAATKRTGPLPTSEVD
jgi:hypothetical protein